MTIEIPDQVPEEMAESVLRSLVAVAESREAPHGDRLKMEVVPRSDGSVNVITGPLGEVDRVDPD